MGESFILSGRVILTAWDREPLWDGALLIEEGKIKKVGERKKLLSLYENHKHFSFPEGLIFPGLVNTHTHASMTIFRGLADDLPLMTWLENYIFPVERHLKRYWVYWGALLAIAEMLHSGVTIFSDMYLFEREVIKAVENSKIRAIVGEGLFDFPSPSYGPLENGLAWTRELLEEYKNHPCIKIMVCPHATYTCSPETLRKAKDLADKFGARLHIHLSENKEEVFLIKKRYGLRPVEHLSHLGFLTENLLIAHGVELKDQEIDLLAQKKVKVAHCPESNLKLASGIAPVPSMLQKGIQIGLGTDGPASNNDLDLITEMRTAALIQKGISRQASALSAQEVFRMATEMGAQALGFDRCGRLEKGYNADLAIIDLSKTHLTPLYDPLSLLVYSAKAGDVTEVMIQGKFVLREGVPVYFDEEEAKEKVRQISFKIKEMLKA